MIIAKPVIDKQFWILQQNNQKVGNVEACAGGFQVRINNTVQQYKTIRMVKQRTDIQFESPTRRQPSTVGNEVHGFPAKSRVYNAVWDVTHRLPLFTKTKKSKSWFAAGWYRVKQNRGWQVVQDPKLITLKRYPYKGPYTNPEVAE
jgi:hypothetical protein